MSIAAQCPNCGASIAFHVSSSLVTVCESCSTVVARTDRGLHDMGKSADLHRTQSPLTLWLSGSFQGVVFQLTGHVQFLHGAGGVWDEWYLHFDDGRWGWLAEAQGRFYLSFRQPDAPALQAQSLVPGNWIQVGNPPVSLAVAETGEAQLMAGRGEIPYYFRPGHRHGYADLSGPGGEFGTLDFSEPTPALYLGREVTLDQLGIAASEPAQEAVPGFHGSQGASVKAVTCSNCGGSLELQAPDRTERVACPYCGAMHDCNHGVLQMLKVLDGPRVKPDLPLGAKASFEGETFTLIGFMRRSTGARFKYFWDEYLLYHPRQGFRWLIHSELHWTYARPLPPGAVEAPPPNGLHAAGETASHDGKTYKLFQAGKARVEYVAGEFYWKVETGDMASTVDYVAPPEMVSGEATRDEIHWSLGMYMTKAEVASSFGDAALMDELPVAMGVAPNQPYRHKAIYKVWGGLLAAAVVALVMGAVITDERQVFRQQFGLEPMQTQTEPKVYFSEPFELSGKQNIEITARGSVDNSWMYVQGDLYNEATGLVVQFDVPLEYYHGYDGGRWTEGSTRTLKYLSAVPAGTYSLRLAVERSSFRKSDTLIIELTQGVLRARAWIFLFLGISFLPIGIAIHHVAFERRRWSQSDYAHGVMHQEFSGDDD